MEDAGSFQFSFGSLFVLAACVCWGLENNCTRCLSKSDPLEIVMIKGVGSGIGSIIIGLVVGESLPVWSDILKILLLGFVAYGLSIYFYVYAQRYLGAEKTSTLLCRRALHRRAAVLYRLQGDSRCSVFHRFDNHDRGHMDDQQRIDSATKEKRYSLT